MKRKKLISIVIPVYNEEAGIPELIKRLTLFTDSLNKYLFEIILVENGSSDNSFNVLKRHISKNKRFKIVQLSKNIGCDGGIEAGIHYAKGDALVIIMADLQEPLELINIFINKWENGYEIVYGVINKRTAGLFRDLGSRIFYKTLNLFTGNIFPENVSDFRLIDRKVYETLKLMKEQNKYLRGLTIWTGFKQIGIPFNRKKRFAGKTKTDFKMMLKVAFNGIFSFSYLPLRLVSLLGIVIVIGSSILMMVDLYLFVVYGRETPGIMTVIIILLVLFGVLFFVLGIISEYLVRIYDEVKNRPIFIEKNRVNL